MIPKPITTLAAMAALSSVALNSCYFNSAGYITDAASHTALMDTSELKIGQAVYTNGVNYYLEIPHVRFDSPVVLQYSAFDSRDHSRSTSTKATRKSGSVMVEVPADFARYLTGESTDYFDLNGKVKIAENPDLVRTYPRKPIVNMSGAMRALYDYNSPNSGWLWTAAVFDWMLVDFPITVTQSSLMVVVALLSAFNDGVEHARATGSLDRAINSSAPNNYSADYEQEMSIKQDLIDRHKAQYGN